MVFVCGHKDTILRYKLEEKEIYTLSYIWLYIFYDQLYIVIFYEHNKTFANIYITYDESSR